MNAAEYKSTNWGTSDLLLEKLGGHTLNVACLLFAALWHF